MSSSSSSLTSDLRNSQPAGDGKAEVLVRVENVSKIFCRDFKKSLLYGLKDSAKDLFSLGRSKSKITSQGSDPSEPRILRPGEFWANKDIAFELRRGECLGLIGHNGAGKTTLLKMLNGLIKPDVGRIEMRGQIGALIALGAGFNPLLSGRENVYINAAVLGLKKADIDDQIDGIIEFSGIGEFIDAPVQTYSSGMQVRLGFAIATAAKPDILIIDEVLAVGDTNFKVKCYNRIRDVSSNCAIIFVSHNMFDVAKTCDRVLVLNKGECNYMGNVDQGIETYNTLNYSPQDSEKGLVLMCDDAICSVKVMSVTSETLDLETSIELKLEIEAKMNLHDTRYRVVFFGSSGIPIAEWNSGDYKISYDVENGKNHHVILMRRIKLISGRYRMVVVMSNRKERGSYYRIDDGLHVDVSSVSSGGAAYRI